MLKYEIGFNWNNLIVLQVEISCQKSTLYISYIYIHYSFFSRPLVRYTISNQLMWQLKAKLQKHILQFVHDKMHIKRHQAFTEERFIICIVITNYTKKTERVTCLLSRNLPYQRLGTLIWNECKQILRSDRYFLVPPRQIDCKEMLISQNLCFMYIKD